MFRIIITICSTQMRIGSLYSHPPMANQLLRLLYQLDEDL